MVLSPYLASHPGIQMSSSNHMCARLSIQTTKQYNSKSIKPNQNKLRLPQVFQFYIPTNHDAFTPLFRPMVQEQHTFKDLLTNPTLLDKVSIGGQYSFLSPCQAFKSDRSLPDYWASKSLIKNGKPSHPGQKDIT